MSKAVLIMDMPENCFHCKLQDWANCRIVKGCHTGNKRPNWCPLQPIPEYLSTEVGLTEFQMGVRSGYNLCIDNILKGSEEE